MHELLNDNGIISRPSSPEETGLVKNNDFWQEMLYPSDYDISENFVCSVTKTYRSEIMKIICILGFWNGTEIGLIYNGGNLEVVEYIMNKFFD